MTPDLSGAVWRKSSRSGGNGGQCVEMACLPTGKAIRDSKNPNGGVLILSESAWANLLSTLRDGARDA